MSFNVHRSLRNVLGLLLFVCLFTNVNAQLRNPGLSKVNLYVDAGFFIAGQASLNIEKIVHTNLKSTFYARIGIGGAELAFSSRGFGGLVALTFLRGKQNNHFEVNAGVFVGQEESFTKYHPFALPLLDFGYRYQKPEGGFLFKAKAGFLGIGIGLGYSFPNKYRRKKHR